MRRPPGPPVAQVPEPTFAKETLVDYLVTLDARRYIGAIGGSLEVSDHRRWLINDPITVFTSGEAEIGVLVVCGRKSAGQGPRLWSVALGAPVGKRRNSNQRPERNCTPGRQGPGLDRSYGRKHRSR